LKISFAKMEGLGNDFVVIENLAGKIKPAPLEVRFLCDRHFGIGADGVLLVEDSRAADLKMRIFNADGTEAETCGNGIRCFALYAFQRGLVSREDFQVETGAGVVDVKLKGGQAQVDLGRPLLEASAVPVNLPGRVINRGVTVGGAREAITCLSLGNPHCVIFLPRDREINLDDLGGKISHDPLFPNRTNVEFVRVVSPREIEVKVWERGVGPTLACGTGAAAAAVAGVLNRKTFRRQLVHLPGGDLRVEWSRSGRVLITGPANLVFFGQIELPIQETGSG